LVQFFAHGNSETAMGRVYPIRILPAGPRLSGWRTPCDLEQMPVLDAAHGGLAVELQRPMFKALPAVQQPLDLFLVMDAQVAAVPVGVGAERMSSKRSAWRQRRADFQPERGKGRWPSEGQGKGRTAQIDPGQL